VCPEHTPNREQQNNTQTQYEIMSKPTKTPPNGPPGATASTEPNYRINPEVEAKIDDWIKQNSKSWKYIQAMPRDRLERTVALNEVRQLDRRQRLETGLMEAINNDPTRKQAYDILTKDMSQEQREDFILKVEREKWRTQQQSQSQTQTRKEAVSV
jgi:NCAIR mutase (PurE)-related protein